MVVHDCQCRCENRSRRHGPGDRAAIVRRIGIRRATARAVKLALRLKRPPARIVPLATAAWLQARAGDRAAAKHTIAKCAETIASHPSPEARAVMGMELAAAQALVGDKGGAVKRLAAGLASL